VANRKKSNRKLQESEKEKGKENTKNGNNRSSRDLSVAVFVHRWSPQRGESWSRLTTAT
jgi:hypothetical protein